HNGPPLTGGQWRGILELDIEAARTLRDLYVEGVDVDRVAHPFNALPPDTHHEPREPVDRAPRRVITWQPLRIQQRERPRLHRNALVDVEDMPPDVRGVHSQRDDARVGRVLRRWHGAGRHGGRPVNPIIGCVVARIRAGRADASTFRRRNFYGNSDRTGGPQKCRDQRDDAGSAHLGASTLATACAKYSMFSRRKPAMLIRLSSVMYT